MPGCHLSPRLVSVLCRMSPLFQDGHTAETCRSGADAGRDWPRQLDDQKWQNDICLEQRLAGRAVIQLWRRVVNRRIEPFSINVTQLAAIIFTQINSSHFLF